jgi:hypothetical protein
VLIRLQQFPLIAEIQILHAMAAAAFSHLLALRVPFHWRVVSEHTHVLSFFSAFANFALKPRLILLMNAICMNRFQP